MRERPRAHRAFEPLSEVVIARPGRQPVQAVLRANEVSRERIDELEKTARDLPRLEVSKDTGAVDVKLESPSGEQIKAGAVLLERGKQHIAVPQDPISRRFRADKIPAGEYTCRAASSKDGRAESMVTVRADDVARLALRLDGKELRGTTKVKLAIKGGQNDRVRVRVLDKETGHYLLDTHVDVVRGIAELEAPYGRLHFQIDDEEVDSCYDTDNTDISEFLPPLLVELIPKLIPEPDPPPEWAIPLGEEFREISRFLNIAGIDSLETLAAAEPEQLMHRQLELGTENGAPLNRRLFADAVTRARSAVGATPFRGRAEMGFKVGGRRTFSRSFRPDQEGPLEFALEVPAGQELQLKIEGVGRPIQRKLSRSETISIPISKAELEAKSVVRVELSGVSNAEVRGLLRAHAVHELFDPGIVSFLPTPADNIQTILASLAVQNPGLSTTMPAAVMAPENIQMWLDRARTLMNELGVCSILDLGRFRLDPMRIMRTGAYLAPAVQPPQTIHPVLHYKFSELIQNSVLYYQPNFLLHETAVILAGEWDLRGQDVVIGKEVRELVVIAQSIRYDGASRITWETPALAQANTYWPNIADRGPDGVGPGANGIDGADGDQNPHPNKNGGANATTAAPIVTMYLLNATNGLPPIELHGQNGGIGGRGQNGGAGGNGAEGLRADGTFFGGCCRGVGRGGDGGRGGDAGRGGKGGRGGDGGRVTILTTPDSLAVLAGGPPMIDVRPGSGGAGGPPGSPGAGGAGGPAGTADCEIWCDEHPERTGGAGGEGGVGIIGAVGDPGPAVVADAIQLLPITAAQWLAELNNPHILSLNIYDAEPGQTVTITGRNFDPAGDRVFFDGENVGPVASATTATFVVPNNSGGGLHPVVIRPATASDRRSNRAMLRVLPKLLDLPAQPRWIEGQTVTLNGLAFVSGAQVFAEDRSTSPVTSYLLPAPSLVTRTSITLQIPAAPMGNLRGVRRIVVRNPDGGASRDERVIRLSDTIVVRCTAFRVVGSTPGTGTTRSAAQIASLFDESNPLSVSVPWGQARISFRLVSPVANITTTDADANLWPLEDDAAAQALFNSAPGVLGTIAFFFVRDVDLSTAFAGFGGGPIFFGDEPGFGISPVDFQQIAAHEIGHALCLRHVCSVGEGPGTFFNRSCESSDEGFLMYPHWNVSDGMVIHSGQVAPARSGATHLEDGKTASLPAGSLFNGNNTVPQCGADDTQN